MGTGPPLRTLWGDFEAFLTGEAPLCFGAGDLLFFEAFLLLTKFRPRELDLNRVLLVPETILVYSLLLTTFLTSENLISLFLLRE